MQAINQGGNNKWASIFRQLMMHHLLKQPLRAVAANARLHASQLVKRPARWAIKSARNSSNLTQVIMRSPLAICRRGPCFYMLQTRILLMGGFLL